MMSLMVGVVCMSVHLSTLHADQTAEELPVLFDQLLEETDPMVARGLESQIWNLWLEPPTPPARMKMSQLSRAMSAGQLPAALQFANELVDVAPEYAEAWNKRATIHYLMGNLEASVADIRETLLREPRHFGAISGLGLIFMRENNLQAAVKAFEQVLAISPASESARLSLEQVSRKLGREI